MARRAGEPPAPLRKAAALLGDISYPLYAVHASVGIVYFYLGWRFELPVAGLMTAYLLTAGVAAVLLERWWGISARRWLADRLALMRSAEPSVL